MKSIILLILLSVCRCVCAQEIGKALPRWREGMLDLHHINTGRGDAAFYILPDGTTFLLDAGEMPPMDSPRRTPPHPDGSKLAHEWIAIYVKKFMPPISNGQIDYDDGGQPKLLSARSLKDPIRAWMAISSCGSCPVQRNTSSSY